MQSIQQRLEVLEAAQQQQAGEQAAARRRLLAMGQTGRPTPPAAARPVNTKAATS